MLHRRHRRDEDRSVLRMAREVWGRHLSSLLMKRGSKHVSVWDYPDRGGHGSFLLGTLTCSGQEVG